MATIRDYNVWKDGSYAIVQVIDTTKSSYAALPTLSELKTQLGSGVTKIYLDNCFYGCDNLIEPPSIPSNVESMTYCFASCTSLERISTIPSGVKYMDSCFEDCQSLESVSNIPSTVISMTGCFDGCTSLTTTPTIPSGIDSLFRCFRKCTSLTTAPTIPSGVTDMYGCFSGCTSLTTSPAIPSSVTDMGSCFSGCRSLTTAPTIPSNVTNMSYCFHGCNSPSFTLAPAIPNSVTNMERCFAGCTSLTTAPTIPSSVTNMYGCFINCTALTGKATIDATPTSYASCFENTTLDILLFGASTLLPQLAATANYNNAYVWSLSTTITAERQEENPEVADVSVTINRFRGSNDEVGLTFKVDGMNQAEFEANETLYYTKNGNEYIQCTSASVYDPTETYYIIDPTVTMDTATKTYTTTIPIDGSSVVSIAVIAKDGWGTSALKSVIIPIPFYTIDFLNGGRGISFGMVCASEGFHIGMDTVTLGVNTCVISFDDANETITVTETGDDADLVTAIKNAFSYSQACSILGHTIS